MTLCLSRRDYQVVLADPPWAYYGDPNKPQAAGKHYAMMVLVGSTNKTGRPLPLLTEAQGQVILAPRPGNRHSAKPLDVHQRIVELYGDVPRVELFARDRVAGWDVWGNEV